MAEDRNKPLAGIMLMTTAMALFVVKDSFAKIIVSEISPAQIIWTQQLAVFILLGAATLLRHGRPALIPTPYGWQAVRGLASVTGIGALYWALSYIPLADATAMASVAPAVVVLLSPLLIGERIGPLRIIAVLVGFAGVLIILRPGFGGRSVGYLIALGAGVFMALFYVGNRRLAGLHPPLATIAHNALFGVAALAPAMPFVWTDPVAGHLFDFSCFLAFSVTGQSLLVSAFLFAPAFTIAPYQYTNILFSIVAGYVVFTALPGTAAWIGIVLITASGIFIALREAQLARAPQTVTEDQSL